jgi:hypothetical protein
VRERERESKRESKREREGDARMYKKCLSVFV